MTATKKKSKTRAKKSVRWIPRVTYVTKRGEYKFLMVSKGFTKLDAADVLMHIFGKNSVKIKAGFKRVTV